MITQITVSGSDLTDNVTITAPAGYQVTPWDQNQYSSSITLVPTNGSVYKAINVRLSPTASVAGSPYSGNIVVSSPGATSVNVATTPSYV